MGKYASTLGSMGFDFTTPRIETPLIIGNAMVFGSRSMRPRDWCCLSISGLDSGETVRSDSFRTDESDTNHIGLYSS